MANLRVSETFQDCNCGPYLLAKRSYIEEIALAPSCDAFYDVNKCQAGDHELDVDLWELIQTGKCECVTFETDPRTLRLYFNDHPLVIEQESLTRKYSPQLSLAALASVVLSAFFFFSVWFKRKVDRRRSNARQTRRRRPRVVMRQMPVEQQSVVVEELPDSPARESRALEMT